MSETKCQMEHSLGRYFTEWCEQHPDATALMTIDKDNVLKTSYRQLFADVMAWAAFLKEKGVVSGDRVVFISTKGVSHSRFFFACWHIGAIAVPVCETLGDSEMSFIIKDCEAKIVIADKPFVKKATVNAGGIPVIGLDELPFNVPLETPKAELAECELDSIAVLIYTSGSTGMPKGVMLSHKNQRLLGVELLPPEHKRQADFHSPVLAHIRARVRNPLRPDGRRDMLRAA